MQQGLPEPVAFFLELLVIHINLSQVVEGDMVYNTKRLLHPPPSQTNQQNPRNFQWNMGFSQSSGSGNILKTTISWFFMFFPLKPHPKKTRFVRTETSR